MRSLFQIFCLLMACAVHAVEIGKPAPNFTLKDSGGEIISLSDFRGKHVVLEWFNPDCVRVQRHYQQKTMRKLARQYMGRNVIWLAINSTYYMRKEDNVRWKDTNRLHYRLLGDFSGDVARLYQAKTTPHIYIINPTGILIYQGAIDNDLLGTKAMPFKYVQVVLDKSLQGKPIIPSKTKPYGCLVKYYPY